MDSLKSIVTQAAGKLALLEKTKRFLRLHLTHNTLMAMWYAHDFLIYHDKHYC